MYNINAQILAMSGLFPRFKCKRGKEGALTFSGSLYIAPEFDEYTISVAYNGYSSPIVKIISPEILPNAPHTYKKENGQELCLYHPKLFSWERHYLISECIMPWVASWVYFYEIWVETGKWEGPEAPHNFEDGTHKDNESNPTPGID
jgi:hypothetical protein